MTAVEAIENPFPAGARPGEINGERAAARLHYPADLFTHFSPRLVREMMKHYRCEYDVEMRCGKGQGLRECLFEGHVHAQPSRLLLGSGDHFRRRINPTNHAGGTHLAFRSN